MLEAGLFMGEAMNLLLYAIEEAGIAIGYGLVGPGIESR
jgi:hypothetical protein